MTNWSFPQENRHKARKSYECDMCGFIIHPGEYYRRLVDVDRGAFVTTRYCDYCDVGLFLWMDYVNFQPGDLLPNASDLQETLEDFLSDDVENFQEVRSSVVECLARLNKKLGWDK